MSEQIEYDSCTALDLAIKIGVNMLKSGAEVRRVEKTVTYICEAYGATNVNVFSLPTLILLSASIDGHNYQSKIARNHEISIDLYRIEKYNTLSRKISRDKLAYQEVEEEIQKIENKKDYHLFFFILGAFVCSFGFSLFFGGHVIDGICSGVIAAITYILNFYKPKNSNQILHTLICSLVGGGLSYLVYVLNIATNLSSVIVGAIMILIPGLMMSTSIRDIFIDDVMSGSLRLFQSFTTSLAIAAGFSIWTVIYKEGITLETDQISWIMFIGAVLGTFGFSIIFNSKYKRLPYAIVGGVVTTIIYLLCLRTFKLNNVFSNLIAALIGGVYSEIMARVVKAPSTSFLLPSLVPLVPGASLFFTMYNLVNSETALSLKYLGSTMFATLSIAFGMVVASVIFMNIPKKKKENK